MRKWIGRYRIKTRSFVRQNQNQNKSVFRCKTAASNTSLWTCDNLSWNVLKKNCRCPKSRQHECKRNCKYGFSAVQRWYLAEKQLATAFVATSRWGCWNGTQKELAAADWEVLRREPFAEVKSQTQNELFSVTFAAIKITVYHTSDPKSMI
jgi:hypothetical protein